MDSYNFALSHAAGASGVLQTEPIALNYNNGFSYAIRRISGSNGATFCFQATLQRPYELYENSWAEDARWFDLFGAVTNSTIGGIAFPVAGVRLIVKNGSGVSIEGYILQSSYAS